MKQPQRSATIWAHRIFFPAACCYAALVVPLSVFAMYSGNGWPLALMGKGHGFEMLFGFALAVVAGYTLGPTPPRLLAGLFVLWLVARLAQFIAPFSLPSMLMSGCFGLALGWRIVPRFIAAKKWRNRLLMPLLGGLCVLPASYLVVQQMGLTVGPQLILYETVLFLSLLMAFMGGRVIAPALAIPGGAPLAGVMAILAGILIVFRLLRWQLWHCGSRPDLLGLCLGYLWLAATAWALCFGTLAWLFISELYRGWRQAESNTR